MKMSLETCMKLKSKDSLMKLRRRSMRLKKETIVLNVVEKKEKQRLLILSMKMVTFVMNSKKTTTEIVQESLN